MGTPNIVEKMFAGKEEDLTRILSMPSNTGVMDTRQLTQEIRMCLVGSKDLIGNDDTAEQAEIREIADKFRYHINYVLMMRGILKQKKEHPHFAEIIKNTIFHIQNVLRDVVDFREMKNAGDLKKIESGVTYKIGVILYFKSSGSIPMQLRQRIKVTGSDESILEFPDASIKLEGDDVVFVSSCTLPGVFPLRFPKKILQRIECYRGVFWEEEAV